MNEAINSAFQRFVGENVSASDLYDETAEVDESDGQCYFVVVGQNSVGEPIVEHFDGPIDEDDCPEVDDDKLAVVIPIDGPMTVQDLLGHDVAEASEWQGNPAWNGGDEGDEE